MLPLKATPCEAASEAVELPEGTGENRQIAREVVEFEETKDEGSRFGLVVDSAVPNVARDAQASIQRALAVLRADLKVVEEAIQALESIAPEARTERSCESSMQRPLTAPIPKPRKVVDIHTKRA